MIISASSRAETIRKKEPIQPLKMAGDPEALKKLQFVMKKALKTSDGGSSEAKVFLGNAAIEESFSESHSLKPIPQSEIIEKKPPTPIKQEEIVPLDIDSIDPIKLSHLLEFYDINIDDSGTSAFDPGSVTILIDNDGLFNVTVDSVYINGTYFSVIEFTSDNGYDIATGESLELTINMATVEAKLGISISDDDILEILVRTTQGAEDIHQEIVK